MPQTASSAVPAGARSLFGPIFRFELLYQLRQPIFAVCAAVFFLLTFGAVTSDVVTIGGSVGAVNRNAPYVIMQILLVMSIMGVFVATAFVASAVQRDFEHGTHEILFSTPMRKRDYLLGRFFGALVTAMAVFAGVVLAVLVGSMMPWLEAERIGPTTAAPYLFSLAVIVLPNILLSGAIFFSLATITRSMLWTFAGVIGFFVAYFVGLTFMTDLENQFLASILDPFGAAAFQFATKYWTVAEKNRSILPLGGVLLWNRLLWLGVAAAILSWTVWRFRFSAVGGRRRAKRAMLENGNGAPVPGIGAGRGPAVGYAGRPEAAAAASAAPSFTRAVSWRQFLQRSWLETIGVLRGAPFMVILGFGMINIIGNSTSMEELFGTPVWPVTHLMLRTIEGAFGLTLVLILTWYSGELTWRERAHRMDGVMDALPAPTWVFWSSKLTALLASMVVLYGAAALTAMGIQASHGYFRFEPMLYVKGLLLVEGIQFALFAVLAIALQSVLNNRYLGYLLMVLVFISNPVLSALGWEHRLYRYAGAPDAPYSDMNGYGHFGAQLFSFGLYWLLFAVLLGVATHLFWVRGVDTGLRQRLTIARGRFGAAPRAIAACALAGFAGTGGWIYYNTNILNHYQPRKAVEDRQAAYEKKYKKYEKLDGPRITAVRAEVDIYPERRAAEIRGTYTLRNKTDHPIEEVILTINPDVKIRRLELPGSRVTEQDDELGFLIRRLDAPLAPGAETTLAFEVSVVNNGFLGNGAMTKIVANGTFFDSSDYFPHFGYFRELQLQDPNERRKRGLEPVVRFPKLEDESARKNTYISHEADWVTFETTVSTSTDQIAIAPGYLRKEWTEKGRRYFHYAMDAPILNFWSYLSARWEVKRDRWNDVAIEVYYDPAHPYNVDRMIEASKKSLDYFTKNFGPYQHRQVRIIEFPRYARFAQSFPNTIPFSESIGFIARITKPEDIDYVFYVTAHEIAHQWWAHQVIGADCQGSTMLSESLSQYSALMVMEKEYGRDLMRKFLKYELEAYLRGRGGERVEELPLMRVESQGYIHYRKGSLIMYALRDAIGEEALNGVLARFVRDMKFQDPPYTTTLEFMDYLRGAVPEERQVLLKDLFEEITLYENRAESAAWSRRPDGKYEVRLEVASAKFHAAGSGAETAVSMDEWVDVGVFGAKGAGTPPEGKVLLIEKRRLTAPKEAFTLVVDEQPVRAGVDPFNKLIDRSPENNLVAVAAR